jgi:hypothetical protein
MNSISKNRSKINNAIKVISILAWITFIGIANIRHHMIIEAFLLSVGIVVIGYLIHINFPGNSSGLSSTKDRRAMTKNNPSSKNYLQVFFNTSVD